MSTKMSLLRELGLHSNYLLRLDPATKQRAIDAAASRLRSKDFLDVDVICREILRHNSDDAAARKLLFEAAALRRDAVVLYELGEYYLTLRDRVEAARCFGEAVALGIHRPAQKRQFELLQQSEGQFAPVSGRRVVVTGGASGIGKAIVDRLLGLGATVLAIDRDDGALASLNDASGRLSRTNLDLNDVERVSTFAKRTEPVDTVVLNAAAFQSAEFRDIESGDIVGLLRNNFVGNAILAQQLATRMVAGGRIIIIGTSSEHVPVNMTRCASYIASKAALSSFFFASCSELAQHRIMVNEVLWHDSFDTPMARQVRATAKIEELAAPTLVSEALIPFFIADPDDSFITGCSIMVHRGKPPFLVSVSLAPLGAVRRVVPSPDRGPSELGSPALTHGPIAPQSATDPSIRVLPTQKEAIPGKRVALTLEGAIAAIDRLKREAIDPATARPGSALAPMRALVKLQKKFRRDFGVDKAGFRIIGRAWLNNIGQIAHLDTYFKMKVLNWLEPGDTIVCCDGGTPVNWALLACFAPYVRCVVADKSYLGEYARYAPLLEESTVAVLLANGTAANFHGMFYDVEEQWLRDRRPPLISLNPGQMAAGRTWLSQLGVPDDAWFVTFHFRTGVHQDLKSVDERTYGKAIAAVLSAGGWVVCMGAKDPPADPRIINFERLNRAKDWQDIFLLAGCRFFVGCTSGPSQIASAFGTPSIMTNAVQLGSQALSHHDLFIPKLYQSRLFNRPLTIEEILGHVTTSCGSTSKGLDDLGLDDIPNTPQQIEAVVQEMIDQLDGAPLELTEWDEAAQRRLRSYRQFAAVGNGPIVGGKTRMGRDFLRHHARALGLAP